MIPLPGQDGAPIIPPRICESCGARAFVSRRTPAPANHADQEMQTFHCSACDWQIEIMAPIPLAVEPGAGQPAIEP